MRSPKLFPKLNTRVDGSPKFDEVAHRHSLSGMSFKSTIGDVKKELRNEENLLFVRTGLQELCSQADAYGSGSSKTV